MPVSDGVGECPRVTESGVADALTAGDCVSVTESVPARSFVEVVMPRPSRKRLQKRHARRRAWERHGLILHEAKEREILQAIWSNDYAQVRHLRRQSNRVSILAVWVDGAWLPVCYDKVRKQLASVLPADCLEMQGVQLGRQHR